MKLQRFFHHLFFVLMILAVAVVGFSKDEAESVWTETPVRIDGMKTEWDADALNSHKKTKVDYGFMNDGQYLYILFVFNDPEYLSSIGMTGMNVWFSRLGKKKKEHGIKFIKKKISADDYIALLEEQVEEVPEEKKNQIRQNPFYIMFDHRVITKEDEVSEGAQAQKIEGALYKEGRIQKTVFYECVVPLQKLAVYVPELADEKGKGLNVGFEWGGATKEIKEAIASRMAARDIKADAGRATSLKGERRGGSSSDLGALARMRKRLPKKYDFWVELKLAQQ